MSEERRLTASNPFNASKNSAMFILYRNVRTNGATIWI